MEQDGSILLQSGEGGCWEMANGIELSESIFYISHVGKNHENTVEAMEKTLSIFEYDVMNKLLSGKNNVLATLREQIENSCVVSREYGTEGLYIEFKVDESKLTLDRNFSNARKDFCFGDVIAKIPSLNIGVGFLLWVSNGLIDELEGYTFDERLPQKITKYELNYIDGKRDLEKLCKEWIK